MQSRRRRRHARRLWEVHRVALPIGADALAEAVQAKRGVNVAGVPPGTAVDDVEAAAQAVGRSRELDGALIFETPLPGGAVDRVVRQIPLRRRQQAGSFSREGSRLWSCRWRWRHNEAGIGDVSAVRQFVL
jgi:hypothetical protein